MRNKFLLIALMGLFLTGAYAQESETPAYNKWSLEGGVGMNKPFRNFTPGYRSPTPGLWGAELGVRYMINEYFGFKGSFMYDSFSEDDDSPAFDTKMYSFNVQGVANLGRMMKFQTWTHTFNLLAHAGPGVGILDYDVDADTDYIGNLLAGVTVQAKLSPRVSLYGDVTGINVFRPNLSFNGGAMNHSTPLVVKGTIGLSIALGKQAEHADWYLSDESLFDALGSRVSAVEQDLAANKSNDQQLENRVAELSSKVDGLDQKVSTMPTGGEVDTNELIAKLINDGYVNIYFDFNSSKVKGSVHTVNVLRTYLINNPDVTVDLLGYADERGTEEYNQVLSQKRADAVAALLTKSGVDPSRLNAQGRGEDLSIDMDSPEAYQLARRVTFQVK